MNNNYDNTDDDNRPEKQEDYNPMISKKKEKEFNFVSRELESYWDIGRNAAQEVGKRVNILISILHEDHPDWSFNKIANTLSIKFEHLEGFSRATIYRNINESNRRLLQNKVISCETRKLNNNILEDSVYDEGKQKDIEDSSSKKSPYQLKKEKQLFKDLDDAYKSLNDVDDEEEEEDNVEEPEIDNTFNQLPKPVVSLAKKIELLQNKLRLITNPRLKEHPEIQRDLVKEIAPLTIDEAKINIAQVVRDLETGALFKSGKSYHLHTHLRGKIESKPEVEKSPHEYYFDLMKDMLKFLEHITGHEIVKGECEYTEKHIEYTEKHRIEMIKSLDERTVRALKDDLKVVRSGINSMLDIIDKEVIGKKDSD